MTAFVCTLAPSFATVTTDSLARFADGGIGTVDKIRTLPSRAAVVAGSGSLGMVVEWHARLSVMQGASDVRQIIALAPTGLADMWQAFPEAHGQGLRVVHIGWTPGGPAGAAHEFPDFAAQALAVGRGHCLQPMVDPTAPGYSELQARWEPAAAGTEVEAFHISVLRNQRWSLDQGRVAGLNPATLIGGALISAKIDADGIHIRRIGELPDATMGD